MKSKTAQKLRRVLSTRPASRARGASDRPESRRSPGLKKRPPRLRPGARQTLRPNLPLAHKRLDDLYRRIPLGFIVLDEKGAILDWNSAALELLKPPRKKPAPLPLHSFVLPEDRPIVDAHLRRCRHAAARGQVISEVRLQGTNQRATVLQLVSTLLGNQGGKLFQTALVDLTEQRASEQLAVQAGEFSDTIIQTIHEPLAVLDSDLKIVRVNDAFASLFRLAGRAAQPVRFDALLNVWWSGNQLRARLDLVLLKNFPLSNFEYEADLPELGRRIFLINAVQLPQKQGAAPFLLLALEDITTRKEAEQKLAESNRELHQLNERLEKRVEERTRELRETNRQLERFCYTLAHDLRGPLRSMAGFANALREDFAGKLGQQAADYVGRIVGAAQQMEDLIRDLLQYQRFNTLELKATRVDATQVLTSVLAGLQPAIRQTGARIELREALPPVLAHPVVLEAAFFNIISNALKFVPAGTRPKLVIWPEERADRSLIWFSDNGMGIDPQYQSKIFEVFQRLHSQSSYPGTGVGLAIVRRALQRVNGEVGVESKFGQGSRFWVSLPKPPSEPVESSPSTNP